MAELMAARLRLAFLRGIVSVGQRGGQYKGDIHAAGYCTEPLAAA